MNSIASKLKAVTLALVAALAATLALAGVASAQAAPPSLIDPTKATSLTIHKLLRDDPATDKPATGVVDDTAVGTPLANVKFKIEKVTFDPQDPAAWAEAVKLTPKAAEDQLDGTFAAREVTTGTDGTAVAANLPQGLYLVTELQSPDAAVPDGKQLNPAAPFLVFLPMTMIGDETKWNYDVHVYPKNSATGATKEVTDKDKNAGDDVTFTVNADIPTPATADGKIAKYGFEDTIDPAKATYVADSAKVTVDGTDLDAADYTVNYDAGTGTLTVTLTQSGLDKLTAAKKANAQAQAVLTFDAKVSPVAAGDGILKNKATVISNNGGGGGDVKSETNETQTRHIKLRIHKTGEKDTVLAGAKFQVYRCTSADNLGQGPLMVENKNEWVTGADGNVVIGGLHVTDFVNNADGTQDGYCLVETEAPDGYELLPKPIYVDLTSNTASESTNAEGTVVDGGTNNTAVQNISNNQRGTGTQLPLTGGAGIWTLLVIGAIIVAGGAYLAVRQSRKA